MAMIQCLAESDRRLGSLELRRCVDEKRGGRKISSEAYKTHRCVMTNRGILLHQNNGRGKKSAYQLSGQAIKEYRLGLLKLGPEAESRQIMYYQMLLFEGLTWTHKGFSFEEILGLLPNHKATISSNIEVLADDLSDLIESLLSEGLLREIPASQNSPRYCIADNQLRQLMKEIGRLYSYQFANLMTMVEDSLRMSRMSSKLKNLKSVYDDAVKGKATPERLLQACYGEEIAKRTIMAFQMKKTFTKRNERSHTNRKRELVKHLTLKVDNELGKLLKRYPETVEKYASSLSIVKDMFWITPRLLATGRTSS